MYNAVICMSIYSWYSSFLLNISLNFKILKNFTDLFNFMYSF